MKPYFVNLINAVAYISLGTWGYFSSDTPSFTALIPVFAGIIMIGITPGFKRGSRVQSHIAVAITFVVLIGLIKPLAGAIGRSDYNAFSRVLAMIITSLVAITIFLKSFVDARRNS